MSNQHISSLSLQEYIESLIFYGAGRYKNRIDALMTIFLEEPHIVFDGARLVPEIPVIHPRRLQREEQKNMLLFMQLTKLNPLDGIIPLEECLQAVQEQFRVSLDWKKLSRSKRRGPSWRPEPHPRCLFTSQRYPFTPTLKKARQELLEALALKGIKLA